MLYARFVGECDQLSVGRANISRSPRMINVILALPHDFGYPSSLSYNPTVSDVKMALVRIA